MNPQILAIDPGGTTGLAWGPTMLWMPGKMDERFGHMVKHQQIEGPWPEQVDRILAACVKIGIWYVVVESFQIRPHSVLKGGDALTPVRIGSALEYMLRQTNIPLFYQTASQGKGVMTDARLKALGLWWPGEDHARDAARHLVAFLRRVRQGKIAGVGSTV